MSQRSIKLGRQGSEIEDDEKLYNEILDQDGVEGFNDYLLTTPPRGQYLALYRGIAYLEYLDDVTDVRALDDVANRSVTEKLILFQSAETATKLLLDSPLAEIYRRAQRYFRTYQDYTTVKVDRGSQVKLHVGTESSSENTFLRFRIHTSMREGIEPRLEIGENTKLRYDILSQETVLEYGFEF